MIGAVNTIFGYMSVLYIGFRYITERERFHTQWSRSRANALPVVEASHQDGYTTRLELSSGPSSWCCGNAQVCLL